MSTTRVPASLLNHRYSKHVTVAVDAALAAGDIIKHAFKQPKKVEEKLNHADLVTATDKAAEDLIFGRIRQEFPDHCFIGEESSAAAAASGTAVADQLDHAPTWMVDPLDGTTNFVHGFPFVCTSIGLTVGGCVVVGVVYNPVLEELFVGARGGGAFLNGTRLAASKQTRLAGALLGTEIGTARDDETLDAMFSRMRSLTAAARAIRCTGSCALNLCSVAAGRCDAFYEINFGGCWDAAAGALMVAEAGGCVLDPVGGPWSVMGRRVLAAGTRELGQAVAAVLGCGALSCREMGPPGPGVGCSLGGEGTGEEGAVHANGTATGEH